MGSQTYISYIIRIQADPLLSKENTTTAYAINEKFRRSFNGL